MRALLKLTFCCCLTIGAVLLESASAEPLYVDDKLVLNVYAEADQSSGRIATIETGDAVEALEHAEKFVRVRLVDGREGWVSANYLKSQPPAIVRLRERNGASSGTDSKRHADEIARFKKQNAVLQSEIADLKKKPAAIPAVAAAAPAVLPIEPQTERMLETVSRKPVPEPVVVEGTLWWAWLIAVVFAAIGGFVAGYQTLGKRVRERFGGVKVY